MSVSAKGLPDVTLARRRVEAELGAPTRSVEEEGVEEQAKLTLAAAATSLAVSGVSLEEDGTVTVDSRPILGDAGKVLQLGLQPFKSVHQFLTGIWLGCNSSLPPDTADREWLLRPYTYNREWVLRDVETGTIFVDMGSRWTLTVQGQHGSEDKRPLAEGGIAAGMRLEIIRPPAVATWDRRPD